MVLTRKYALRRAREPRLWGGLSGRQWAFLAVGVFMLACLTVPGLMWLLSPRAEIPAFPAPTGVFSGDAATPPAGGTPPPEPGAGTAVGPGAAGAGAAGPDAATPAAEPGGRSRVEAAGAPPAKSPPARSNLTTPAFPSQGTTLASAGQGATPESTGQGATPASGRQGAAPVSPRQGAGGGTDTGGMAATPAPGQLAWPLPGKVVAGYGFAYSEVHGDWRLHAGIDVAGEVGSAVRAAAAGVVRLVSVDPARRCTVEIDHSGGVVTAYLHLGKAVVSQGARVKRGQVIGHLAEPGQEEPGGSHVHFEVRVDGSPGDPLEWLVRR